MHEVVDAFVGERQLVIGGDLPEKERAHEHGRRCGRLRQRAEGASGQAVREDGADDASAHRLGRAREQQRLWRREREQHRRGHVQQQVLHLMGDEDVLGDRVERRLQREVSGD